MAYGYARLLNAHLPDLHVKMRDYHRPDERPSWLTREPRDDTKFHLEKLNVEPDPKDDTHLLVGYYVEKGRGPNHDEPEGIVAPHWD